MQLPRYLNFSTFSIAVS
ncbi:unnamed protein product [Callosobruchus maculatus]|uniref:Uncharacterized protein n=1 Tax=Callosobruchus maculatus TaxID=64391 RepID=A0A653C437_CALMS|nr:unnamed protein product [Callosobruchus maculatus]